MVIQLIAIKIYEITESGNTGGLSAVALVYSSKVRLAFKLK